MHLSFAVRDSLFAPFHPSVSVFLLRSTIYIPLITDRELTSCALHSLTLQSTALQLPYSHPRHSFQPFTSKHEELLATSYLLPLSRKALYKRALDQSPHRRQPLNTEKTARNIIGSARRKELKTKALVRLFQSSLHLYAAQDVIQHGHQQ